MTKCPKAENPLEGKIIYTANREGTSAPYQHFYCLSSQIFVMFVKDAELIDDQSKKKSKKEKYKQRSKSKKYDLLGAFHVESDSLLMLCK